MIVVATERRQEEQEEAQEEEQPRPHELLALRARDECIKTINIYL